MNKGISPKGKGFRMGWMLMEITTIRDQQINLEKTEDTK